MTTDGSITVITMVVLMHMSVVRCATNLFYPDSNPAYQNRVYGTFRYNNSQYLPTCGWKIILTINYPMCSIGVWDATAERVDNYTYVLTNVGYAADPSNRVSSILLVGLYGNTWPTVIMNWLCICDKTTGGACQNVTYETVAPQLAANSSIPCAAVTTIAPTTTTKTTPKSTTEVTTTRQTTSLLSLIGVHMSSNPNGDRIAVKKFGSSCYTGSQSTALTPINHFIDCCSVCCSHTSCLGVNYLPASHECDLVFEDMTEMSLSLSTVPECSFWKVIYRS